MATREEIKRRIQPLLPYGSYSAIKRAIKENKGRHICVETVRNVLNPDKNNWDLDVIEEAQKIAIPINDQIIAAHEKLV